MARDWPDAMIIVGRNLAVAYSSDKWEKVGDFQDYKHLAESPNWLALEPRSARAARQVRFFGPTVKLAREMPGHAAELSPLISIEAALHVGVDREGEGVLGDIRKDEGIWTLALEHAVLFGARVPRTGEPFLFVATPDDGIVAMITGDKLDIKKDGIVG